MKYVIKIISGICFGVGFFMFFCGILFLFCPGNRFPMIILGVYDIFLGAFLFIEGWICLKE
jgi:hypothetical protein